MQRITTRLLIIQKLNDDKKDGRRMLFPNSNGRQKIARNAYKTRIVCRKIGYHAQGGQQYLTLFSIHALLLKLCSLVRVVHCSTTVVQIKYIMYFCTMQCHIPFGRILTVEMSA